MACKPSMPRRAPPASANSEEERRVDDPQAAPAHPHRPCRRRARGRGRSGALRAFRSHRLLQFADRHPRQGNASGEPRQARRAGRRRQHRQGRERQRHLQRHRRQGVGAGRVIRASFPISSAKGRGWSPRVVVGADGVFSADTMLAKHDERYMPKEVVDALKAQGVWQESGAAAPPRRRNRGRRDDRRTRSLRPRAGAGACARPVERAVLGRAFAATAA